MKETVLILEDEELIALDLQNRLNKRGFTAYIATNKKEAMAIFKQYNISLGLIDISLKDEESGISIVKELSKIKQFPIIYITAYDDEEIISQVNKTTPYGYILKPFDEKELFFTISIALEKAKKDRVIEKKQYWITSILNTITDLIIVTDNDHKINFANIIAKKYFDLSVDNQQLDTELIFFDSDNHKFEPSFIQNVIQTKTPVVFSSLTIQSQKTGKKMNATCSFVPLKENKEKVTGVVITVKKSK